MSLSDQLYKKLEDASNDWAEWQKKQTMLINEKKLNMMEPTARNFLETQMQAYLFEGKEPDIEGYVPPKS